MTINYIDSSQHMARQENTSVGKPVQRYGKRSQEAGAPSTATSQSRQTPPGYDEHDRHAGDKAMKALSV
jgi:hypothetical protein